MGDNWLFGPFFALMAYFLAGWRVGIMFGYPRGRPGFVWYVWLWPIVGPLMLLNRLWEGFKLGISDALTLYQHNHAYDDATEEKE